MKILILTCCDRESRKKQLEGLNETKRRLADSLDGVDYLFEVRKTDASKEATWEKSPMLLDHFDDGYDFLLWVDDDAGFIRFDDFRPEFEKLDPNKYAFFTVESTAPEAREHAYLNAGVFAIRPTEGARKMLEWVYEKRKGGRKFKYLNDQPVLIEWFRAHQKDCGLLDSSEFNAFPECFYEDRFFDNRITDRTRIVHLAGSWKRNPKYLSKWFPGCALPEVPPPAPMPPPPMWKTIDWDMMDDD